MVYRLPWGQLCVRVGVQQLQKEAAIALLMVIKVGEPVGMFGFFLLVGCRHKKPAPFVVSFPASNRVRTHGKCFLLCSECPGRQAGISAYLRRMNDVRTDSLPGSGAVSIFILREVGQTWGERGPQKTPSMWGERMGDICVCFTSL